MKFDKNELFAYNSYYKKLFEKYGFNVEQLRKKAIFNNLFIDGNYIFQKN